MSILSFCYRIYGPFLKTRMKPLIIGAMTVVTLHSLAGFAVGDTPRTVFGFADFGVLESFILLLTDRNQLESKGLSTGLLGSGPRASHTCSNQCLHRCRRAYNPHRNRDADAN
jgi:hypothetical protein